MRLSVFLKWVWVELPHPIVPKRKFLAFQSKYFSPTRGPSAFRFDPTTSSVKEIKSRYRDHLILHPKLVPIWG